MCTIWKQYQLNSGGNLSVQHSIDLANNRITLVNDLFSYEKEKQASVMKANSILNAVHYLETVLSVDSLVSKDVSKA
jgi:hypothetical protein